MTLITRKRYMSEAGLHHAYYRQFVTDETLRTVRRRFTHRQLRAALKTDEHLNSIPLPQWDALTFQADGPRHSTDGFKILLPLNRDVWAQANDGRSTISIAELTCIIKAAARIIAEEDQTQ